MNAIHRAGPLRLAALALLSPGAIALGQAAGGVQPSRVMISTRADSAKANIYVFGHTSPRIDSLVQRLNGLALGSEAYRLTEDTLRAALREVPRVAPIARPGREYTVVATQTPRAALRFSALDLIPLGWFGFLADGFNRKWDEPSGQYVQYFEYPTVVAVESNSPAFKAGMKSGDSLIAYDGLDLRANTVNLTRLQTPGREVTVTLRRDGEAKDLTIEVEKAPPAVMAERRAAVASAMAAMRPQGLEPSERMAVERVVVGRATTAPARAPGPDIRMASTAPASGMLGAAMLDVDPNLAKSLVGMEGKSGVLVTFVPAGSIADRTGLRSGDVILRVESDDIRNTAHLRVRFRLAEQNQREKVRLRVLRAGKTVELIHDMER